MKQYTVTKRFIIEYSFDISAVSKKQAVKAMNKTMRTFAGLPVEGKYMGGFTQGDRWDYNHSLKDNGDSSRIEHVGATAIKELI